MRSDEADTLAAVTAARAVDRVPGAADAGPRVLVLVENNSAPSDRRVWAESRSLVEAGYSVTIVCPTGRTKDTAPYESVDGVEIHRYRPREARRAPWGYAIEYGSAIRQMRKLVRRLVVVGGPFDVVHICNPPDILIWAVRSLRTSGAAIVFDHHDLVPELYTVRFGDGLLGLPSRLARLLEHGSCGPPTSSSRRTSRTSGSPSSGAENAPRRCSSCASRRTSSASARRPRTLP